MQSQAKQLTVLTISLVLLVYLFLALAQVGSGSSCHWAFPKWFGCVLSAHETLAAGLIGAAGALIAAWTAWTAVQVQITAEHKRMMADRLEVERLLADNLSYYADGMAAAWRLLVALPDNDLPTPPRICEATAYMAEWISRPEDIANYREMVEILDWDRRIRLRALLNGLEDLRKFSEPETIEDRLEVLNAIRNLSHRFEELLPDTYKYFDGLWRRAPKGMSFADFVANIGSVAAP